MPSLNIFRNPIYFIAYGFGAGLSPKAPGTCGTLMAIPFYYYGLQYLTLSQYLTWLSIASLCGIWICDKTARALAIKDPAGIVWDEMVGYWITMCLAPHGITWIAVGFVLFRLFDILKPWPIAWLDKNLQDGLGIMLDDIAAGIGAWAVLQALAFDVTPHPYLSG